MVTSISTITCGNLAPDRQDSLTQSQRTLPLLTFLALIAFAGNSLLARLALTRTQIDPASFTTIRLVAGALVLLVLVLIRRGEHRLRGSWPSAVALFVYAAGFSFAYVTLSAGTGALLLFGAVQATMISVGVLRGERLTAEIGRAHV